MFFSRSNEKELKMIWEVVKNHKRSYLVGTAHFFPYSFKTSLHRCLENADTVMFEGPLDPDNMAKVVNRGIDNQSSYHIFDDLDRQSINRITRELAPQCRGRNTFFILNLRKFKSRKSAVRNGEGNETLAGVFYHLVQLSEKKRLEILG